MDGKIDFLLDAGGLTGNADHLQGAPGICGSPVRLVAISLTGIERLPGQWQGKIGCLDERRFGLEHGGDLSRTPQAGLQAGINQNLCP